MQKKALCFVLSFFIFSAIANAESFSDTLFLSLPDAEKIFLQKNLSLLAAKYNIDANKALIKQARLWDNPVLTTDQNIYDGAKGDGKFFAHDKDRGQFYVQVTELIRTAGKRSKLAQIATDNATLSEQQFDEVLRSLRYALRTDMIEIQHQLKIKHVYESEIVELKKLIAGMDQEFKAGNVALKDVVRLKALLFSLQNELVNTQSLILPAQNEIKLLLQSNDSSFIAPAMSYHFGDLVKISLPPLDSLVADAINNRPDAKTAKFQITAQNNFLAYQKALAKPDVTVGTEYDQRSSYNPNYVGLTVGLPLTVFNKNKGGIQSAQYAVKQQEVLFDLQYCKIRNEVNAAVTQYNYLQQVNDLQQLEFSDTYDKLFNNMLKSYQQRQINLLEFIDFMDAYKDTKLKLTEQHNNFLKSAEEINYTTNSNVINIQ